MTIVTTAETFQVNEISKGNDNFINLVNIETIKVNGEFLPPIRDVGTYRGGQVTRNGATQAAERGWPSQFWEAGRLTNAQVYYIRTSILGGNLSGPVTFKGHRYGVSMATGMEAPLITANAMMTLVQAPDTRRYTDGQLNFRYVFTAIEIIEEDMYHGDIYVTGGAVSQDDISTTPELLTAFVASGESNGVTLSPANDSLTVLVAAKYKVFVSLEYTSVEASTLWTFSIYKNGATTGVFANVLAAATPLRQNVFFGPSRTLDLAADDIITIYVNSDDGGGAPDITIIEGSLAIESVSTV